MIAVAREVHVVVERRGAQVLQHRSGGYDLLHVGLVEHLAGLRHDHVEHLVLRREILVGPLRCTDLVHVEIGLRHDIDELGRMSVLVGPDVGDQPLNGVFLGVVPYPAAAVARMFLQADDVPRIRLDDLLNVVSGVGEPERSAGIVLVAGIVGLGRIAVGIFGNRTTAVIEMDHLQRRDVGG